jgi:uncharacterized alkaline shock family protein YloU
MTGHDVGGPLMSETVSGEISIATDVLADLAGFAALECYGIVGMASPSLKDGVAQLLSRDKLRKGVTVHNAEDGVVVDLYVVIEHGTNLTEVSHNLVDRVRHVMISMADVKVEAINVHVQGIKVRS